MKPFSIAAIQLSLAVKDNFTLIEKKAREAIIRFPWLQMIVFSELAVGGVGSKNESFFLKEYLKKCKDLANLFNGPTAVAFSKDAITSAKILTKFSKDHQNLKILGGIMGNELLKEKDVSKIAILPTLDEARAKITGILKSPAQKIISILLAPGSKIAILALKKSKQST